MHGVREQPRPPYGALYILSSLKAACCELLRLDLFLLAPTLPPQRARGLVLCRVPCFLPNVARSMCVQPKKRLFVEPAFLSRGTCCRRRLALRHRPRPQYGTTTPERFMFDRRFTMESSGKASGTEKGAWPVPGASTRGSGRWARRREPER